MGILSRKFVLLVACFSITAGLFAQGTNCVCNGYNSARAGEWSFVEGAHFSRALDNLRDDSLFGPNGVANINVQIGGGVQFLSPGVAGGAHVFFTGLTTGGSYSEDEKTTLVNAVKGGMNLVITGDDTSHDISDLFGVTLVNGGVDMNHATNFDHPIFAGPFGRITQFRGSGTSGHYRAWPAGTQLMATSSKGPSMVLIPRGTLGTGSGAVLMISDVDILSTSGRDLHPNSSSPDIPVTDALVSNIVAFLCSPSTPAVAPHLVFAQFANGENNVSYLNLTNSDGQNQVNVSVTLRDDDGAPFSVNIIGKGAAATFQQNLDSNQTVTFATDAVGTLTSGWAAVRGSSLISGNVLFFAPNLGATGVGASEVAGGFAVPVVQQPVLDVPAGIVEPKDIYNGLAVCNLSARQADIRLELWDQITGKRSDGTTTLTIPPLGHLAKFLFEIYPGFDFRGFKGTLRVISRGGLISVTALQLGDNPGEFTALPVKPLYR